MSDVRRHRRIHESKYQCWHDTEKCTCSWKYACKHRLSSLSSDVWRSVFFSDGIVDSPCIASMPVECEEVSTNRSTLASRDRQVFIAESKARMSGEGRNVKRIYLLRDFLLWRPWYPSAVHLISFFVLYPRVPLLRRTSRDSSPPSSLFYSHHGQHLIRVFTPSCLVINFNITKLRR